VGEIPMANEIDKLGPKDFFMGCLVIVVAIFVVPILVILFKVSIYLAIFIGVIVAIILGIALLGKIVRLIFFRGRSGDKNNSKYIE
jgi:cobalamin biosynthesis protein CobD/CbiB